MGILPVRSALRPTDKPKFVNSGYLDPIAGDVFARLARGKSVLLIGTLGAGKSEVLRRVAARAKRRRRMQVALIDMGQPDPPHTPAEFWRDVLNALRPTEEAGSTDDPAATTRLRALAFEAAYGRGHDLALLIDHAELSDEDWLLEELRAAAQRGSGGPGDDGPFCALVVASTEALRQRLFSRSSPLHGVTESVTMTDCPEKVRRTFWESRLKLVRSDRRGALIDQLDALCSGDPYHIERMSAYLSDVAKGARLTAERVELAITRARNNPSSVAPLLPRYGELVEADPGALRLTLHLLREEGPALRSDFVQPTGPAASVWLGIFVGDVDAWRFRSALTERFFAREFRQHPERVAAALARHGLHSEAIHALAPYRTRFRAGLDALVATVGNWVSLAASPSQAWQNAARALSICFGEETRVARYAPFRPLANAGAARFYEVRPGALERPVPTPLAAMLDQTLIERAAVAPLVETCLRPEAEVWLDDADRPFIVFPLCRDQGPYGAVLLPEAAYSPARGHLTIEARHDHDERWRLALTHIFDRIIDLEAQVLSDSALSQSQRIAQRDYGAGGPRALRAQWLLLTAITAGFGLKFNRAMLLRAVGASRLTGGLAIGHHSQAEQAIGWERAPATLDQTLQSFRADSGGVPAAAATPLTHEAPAFALDDWPLDPIVGPALQDGNITWCEPGQLAQSGLAGLMRVEGASDGEKNPAFLVPLREGERLLGLLVVDKPFVADPVSQEQFDALPAMAFQLALSLRAAEDAAQRRMFESLSALGMERLPYQAAAERIAAITLEALRETVKLLVISTWETSTEPGGLDRRQATIRVARSASAHDWLDGQPRYVYYPVDEACLGPVHEALRGNIQDILDVPAWCAERKYTLFMRMEPDVRVAYSIPMGGGTGAPPRAVISFQTSAAAGFTAGEKTVFDQIAQRAGAILDKARVHESLERGRYLTDRLNQALVKLVEPERDEDLYAALLAQMREFFKLDTNDWRLDRFPDSAVLLSVGAGRSQTVVAGVEPGLAAALARACPRIRDEALSRRQAYIEFAGRELEAREEYGNPDCDAHHALGAEASVWCAVGEGLLLVLAWTTPRRINSAERQNLPLLAMITERTSVLINAERQRLRGQLANSLRVEDYELIEAEQTHQWNRRLRTIRNNAQWAIESLTHVVGVDEVAAALKHLDRISQESGQAQSRLIYGRFKRIENIDIGRWLTETVKDWRSLHNEVDQVTVVVTEVIGQFVPTRPVVLRWILYELLTNAEEAERANRSGWIAVESRLDPMSGETLITLENSSPLPRLTLEALRGNTPLSSPQDVGRGRGLWIVARQVPTLLGGSLDPPGPGDPTTRFTLRLPATLED